METGACFRLIGALRASSTLNADQRVFFSEEIFGGRCGSPQDDLHLRAWFVFARCLSARLWLAGSHRVALDLTGFAMLMLAYVGSRFSSSKSCCNEP